jgi:hypothetical protein
MTHLTVNILITEQLSHSAKMKQMTVKFKCSTWKVNKGKQKITGNFMMYFNKMAAQ